MISGPECRKSATARRSSKKTAIDRRSQASVHLDTSNIAKFYFNEPEFPRLGKLWALAEFHAVIHRRLREGSLSLNDARVLASRFSEHMEQGLWNLIPVTPALRRTSALMISAPRDLFIRTADAVHLATAQEIGERDVWTNDRHMLAAAAYFGLTGRSV